MNAKKCKAMNRVFGFYQARGMRRRIRSKGTPESRVPYDWTGLKARAMQLRRQKDPLTKSLMP